MGNGKRSGLVDGTEKAAAAAAVSSSSSSSSLKCDVGLGLTMPQPSPHHHHHYSSSDESMGVVGYGGDGGSGGGGPIYSSLSNQMACFSDLYDVSGSGSVWPRSFHPFNTDSSFKSPGGNMAAAPAKVAFTETQWQELERQTTIYKYMMASLPVPPQLLMPISKSSSPLPSASQSNMSGFSRSSDPEPWRCRRTDGKKWRCSRDVSPNLKYCERHTHKNKPRSRKPVELPPSHTHTHTTTNSTNTNITTNTNLNTHPLFNLPGSNNPTAQKPTFHIPTMVSGPTYSQPRCTEWLMKGDSIPESTLNQQWQHQLMQLSSSSREGLKRYNEEIYRNWSGFQQHYDEQRESINANAYFDMDNRHSLQNQQPKTTYLQEGVNTVQTKTTRRFIDAWSSGKREEMDELSNKYSISSKGKLPLSSSLSLSMSGDNGTDEESGNAQLGLGMMDPESESGGLKSQWLDPVSWMGSPPGGPLGEALCLGIANNTTKEAYYVPSPHCYSNSTTTSSCSKTSCEDADHGQHFYK